MEGSGEGRQGRGEFWQTSGAGEEACLLGRVWFLAFKRHPVERADYAGTRQTYSEPEQSHSIKAVSNKNKDAKTRQKRIDSVNRYRERARWRI